MLTTGTFLRGLIHIGELRSRPGAWEKRRRRFVPTLERLGFALGRLKTGTPPRLDGRTIDWAAVEMQPGDEPPEPFSALTEHIDNAQVQCGMTRTNEATHRIVRDNVHRSPMYSGQIPAAARAIVRRSKTRSFASASAMGIRFSWSRKGLTIRRSTPMGSPPRCRRRSSARWSRPSRDWRGAYVGPGYAIVDHVDPRELKPTLETSVFRGCSWLGKSTAPPATRRLPPKAWSRP